MELSNRLAAVAALVTEGYAVADIGTDHGYIPIYLAQTGKNRNMIAMDVNDGPLKRAGDHIAAYGLGQAITIRKSDGFQNLEPGEVEGVILAGMGGSLVIKIMTDYPEVTESIHEFILQPQSDLAKVRIFLQKQDYVITAEDMVLEDGKFYPMMRVEHGKDVPYDEAELRYGRILIRDKHPVLRRFLVKEIQHKERILGELSEQESRLAVKRRVELEYEAEIGRRALERMSI